MLAWTGICAGASRYKNTIQDKGGSKLSCFLLKKWCRWKLFFKIVEWNIGLDARNDIYKNGKNKWVWNWLTEKDVNWDFLSDYARNCEILWSDRLKEYI